MAALFRHRGASPIVHPSAVVAPNAVLCGDVKVGPEARILWGAVLTAESGPVRVGAGSLVMEQAVLRGVARHPLRIGDHVLIGPHTHLTGCTVEDEAFIATGASVFNGAVVGARSVVRIHGVVHVGSRLPAGADVPVGWIAVGDPAEILPPDEDRRILELLAERGFSRTVFGLPRTRSMVELTASYGRSLGSYREITPLASAEPPADEPG